LVQHLHLLRHLGGVLSVETDVPAGGDEHRVNEVAPRGGLVELEDIGRLLGLEENEVELILRLLGRLGLGAAIFKVIKELRHPRFLFGELAGDSHLLEFDLRLHCRFGRGESGAGIPARTAEGKEEPSSEVVGFL
jgi:hypothetical protein